MTPVDGHTPVRMVNCIDELSRRVNQLVASVLLLFVSCTTGLHAATLAAQDAASLEDASAILEQAVAEYDAAMEANGRDIRIQKFGRAEQLFRQAMESLPDAELASTDHWLNLGKAALQAEHIGEAIVAFQVVCNREPDNADAIQNLQYARSVIPEWARQDEASALTETLFFWRGFLSNVEIHIWASLAFLFACALVSIGYAKKNALVRNLSAVPLLLWVVLLASTWSNDNGHEKAVVVASEAKLYSADSVNSSLRIPRPLPDGAELTLLSTRDDWTEVEFNGRNGWLKASRLSTIPQ
ncbi:MAG: hypothetical protein ACE361_02080 [Aureliella sp.]